MYIRERRNISKRIKLFFKKKEVFLDSQREIYKGRRATQRDRCARHEFTGATDAVRLVTTCPSIIFYTQPPSLFLPVFFSLCSLSLISFFFFFFFFFLVVVLSFLFSHTTSSLYFFFLFTSHPIKTTSPASLWRDHRIISVILPNRTYIDTRCACLSSNSFICSFKFIIVYRNIFYFQSNGAGHIILAIYRCVKVSRCFPLLDCITDIDITVYNVIKSIYYTTRVTK